MTSVGETLRRARLQRNLELNRIADELKISASMLKAIEEERFDKLPGGVFARSFVRQYARLLKLDEDEIVSELKQVLQPAGELPEITHATPPPETEISLPRMSGWQAVGDHGIRWTSSVGALALMLIVMLACAGAYAWWQRARHPVVAQARPPVATQPATPAPQVEPAPAASAPEPATAPLAAEAAAPGREEHIEATHPDSTKAEPATAAAATPAVAVDPNAPVQLEVVAQEDSWISIRADGEYVFSGVVAANQAHAASAKRNILLKLGNAGGVEVRLNGKSIGPLGAKGAVRTIQLTSGGFQIVPPEAPKPESPNPAGPTESPNPL